MNTNTVQQEAQKKLPQLVKGSATYKLIVPEKVEEKIRYLLRKFPSTEWSGVLFYTHTGSFENNALVITCQDIYPMDLGTSGWTEFKMNEEVTAYMAENIKLFDCETGLVHSHHTLGAFFSGQDNKMLQQEGDDTNCFVSLVVDTRGQYVARITRKVQTKSEVTVKNLGTSYKFFGEGDKDITKEGTETTKVIDKEVIEYFDLEVERHEVTNSLAYLDSRFDEIERKKTASRERFIPSSERLGISTEEDKGFLDYLHNGRKEAKELDLFHGNGSLIEDEITPEDKEKLKEVTKDWTPDAKKIHKAVCGMITCNLIINPDKFDLKQWIHKHMVKVYERIFSPSNTYVNADGFTEWKDFIIQYTIDHFDLTDVPEELLDDDYDFVISKIAEAMWNELCLYANLNVYIQSYQEALECYIYQ